MAPRPAGGSAGSTAMAPRPAGGSARSTAMAPGPAGDSARSMPLDPRASPWSSHRLAVAPSSASAVDPRCGPCSIVRNGGRPGFRCMGQRRRPGWIGAGTGRHRVGHRATGRVLMGAMLSKRVPRRRARRGLPPPPASCAADCTAVVLASDAGRSGMCVIGEHCLSWRRGVAAPKSRRRACARASRKSRRACARASRKSRREPAGLMSQSHPRSLPTIPA
jgi:hypothetical protein